MSLSQTLLKLQLPIIDIDTMDAPVVVARGFIAEKIRKQPRSLILK